MFVRIGLVVAALALLALLAVGIGMTAGFMRITEHGIAFGPEDNSSDTSANTSNIVSPDELLKKKGINYVDPQQAAAEAPKLPAPVVAAQSAKPPPAVGQQSGNLPGGPSTDGRSGDGIIRIAAGSDQPLTDSQGHVWEGASGFRDGEIAHRGDIPVKNSTFPGLYQSERWKVTSWQREIPNGNYIVKLYFAETWDGISKPKQRLFSVGVQDHWIKALDVFAESGGFRHEVIKRMPVTVSDGMLTIRFRPHILDSFINGIEIIPDGPVSVRSTKKGEEGGRFGGTIRIAAGNAVEFADADGRVWGADSGFVGGRIANRGPIPISGTEYPEVYRNERYGMSAWYRKMPNGNYTVNLHFAETSPDVQGPGQRVFHVIVQDQPFRDLDVFRESNGKFHALIKSCHVTVTDGKLAIEFRNTGKNVAEINGIEVIRER